MTEEPTPEQTERERLLSVFEEYYSVPGPDQDDLYDREGLIDGLVAVAMAGAAPQEPRQRPGEYDDDFIKRMKIERPDLTLEDLGFLESEEPDSAVDCDLHVQKMQDELEYRVRTATALGKGGHCINEQVRDGRARLGQIAALTAPAQVDEAKLAEVIYGMLPIQWRIPKPAKVASNLAHAVIEYLRGGGQ